MRPKVIAVVGKHNAGKTTTVEAAIRELRKKGLTIAAIKTIHEPGFTIDTENKDTWRFAQAGANTIVAVSPSEITTIEKVDTSNLTLDQILDRCGDVDIVILEGSKKLHENLQIPPIVAVASEEEAREASDSMKLIVAFTGPYPTDKSKSKIPYVDVNKNPSRLADMIIDAIRTE